MHWLKKLDRRLTQVIQWVLTGNTEPPKPEQQQVVHIHYEVHQHVHLQQDNLYHKVMHKVTQDLPRPLSLKPQTAQDIRRPVQRNTQVYYQ